LPVLGIAWGRCMDSEFDWRDEYVEDCVEALRFASHAPSHWGAQSREGEATERSRVAFRGSSDAIALRRLLIAVSVKVMVFCCLPPRSKIPFHAAGAASGKYREPMQKQATGYPNG
jgi:hypothetical protein